MSACLLRQAINQFGIRNSEFGIRNLEFGIRNSRFLLLFLFPIPTPTPTPTPYSLFPIPFPSLRPSVPSSLVARRFPETFSLILSIVKHEFEWVGISIGTCHAFGDGFRANHQLFN